MPYTIGASHGPFTGRGSFVISKPAGIRSVVTSIPPFVGRDSGNPPRWFWLGRFSLGNIDGFSRSWSLEYAQQLVYPMPAIWELLSYDVRNGASCLFQELVEVPDLTTKMPWDRTPSNVSQWNALALTNNGANNQLWTYTVPTGRRLFLAHAEVHLHRRAVATTPLISGVAMYVAGAVALWAEQVLTAVGQNQRATLGGGGLMVGPGTVVVVNAYDSSTTGQVECSASMQGFLFDA